MLVSMARWEMEDPQCPRTPSAPSTPKMLESASELGELVNFPRLDLVDDTGCSGKSCQCRSAQRRASIMAVNAAVPPLPQIAGAAPAESSLQHGNTRSSASAAVPRNSAIGYQPPLFPMQIAELKRLPVEEALRHVVMTRAGGLQQAFRKMDVDGCGEVNYEGFVAGLQALGFSQRSPLADAFPNFSARDIFKKASRHKERLSLIEFLGFVPVGRCCESTFTQWFAYHNKTSCAPTALVRKPGWKAAHRSTSLPSLGEDNRMVRLPCDVHEENHRRLKIKIRQNRDAGAVAQRGLVSGLLPMEAVPQQIATEKQAAEKWKRRIEGEIHRCGRARLELAEVRGKLAEVTRNAIFQDEFAEVATNLQQLREGLKKKSVDVDLFKEPERLPDASPKKKSVRVRLPE